MLEIIFYAMGGLLGISLLAKMISTFTIRRMVKEAAEIQKSNHKLMKLIKAKFEHASMVSDRVQNVGAFVDKYLYEYRICGIHLNTWRGIPQKSFLIILVLGAFIICENIRMKGMVDGTFEYIEWTGIFVLLLLLLQFVSGEKAKLHAVRNYIIEYLENVCIHRYAKKHNIMEKQEEEAQTETVKEATEDVPRMQIIEKIREEEDRSQQEMRIRAILEEFLA